MTIKELLPKADKFRLVQFLVADLAQDEGVNLLEANVYPVWTPYNTHAAADTLLSVLKEEKITYE